jgi:predicted nucleic acid-binding protein
LTHSKNEVQSTEKRHALDNEGVIEAHTTYKAIPLKLVEVDIEKALRIACKYNIYAYDAYYLETAMRLKLPLLTFDGNMKQIGKDLKLDILEEEDENI